MKKFLLALSILLSSFNLNAATAPDVISKAHKAAHVIKMESVDGGSVGLCSATAIGPNAFLTAGHCRSISAVIKIDDKEADIMGTMSDGLDHEIVLERGVTFKDYVDVVITKQAQADEVFVFGNPDGIPDMYRKGYVSGFKHNLPQPETALEALQRPKPTGNDSVIETFYDFNGYFGDSGSGIFNNDGKVIAVTSFIMGDSEAGLGLKFMGSFELRLTPEQLKQAREYVPPVKPVEAAPKHKSFFDFLKE